jgi:hypothetical protein
MRAEIAAAAVAALHAVKAGLPVQTDINSGFSPPADAAWARIAFVDGAESFASIGGTDNLARQPVLAYADIFTPLGEGDGEAVELAKAVRDGWRRLTVPGARWQRFEEGAEGPLDGEYRKQVVAVFLRSERV